PGTATGLFPWDRAHQRRRTLDDDGPLPGRTQAPWRAFTSCRRGIGGDGTGRHGSHRSEFRPTLYAGPVESSSSCTTNREGEDPPGGPGGRVWGGRDPALERRNWLSGSTFPGYLPL